MHGFLLYDTGLACLAEGPDAISAVVTSIAFTATGALYTRAAVVAVHAVITVCAVTAVFATSASLHCCSSLLGPRLGQFAGVPAVVAGVNPAAIDQVNCIHILVHDFIDLAPVCCVLMYSYLTILCPIKGHY